MGLAERFKNKLENRNIFEKNAIEQKLEENDIKFISKPAEEVIEQKNANISSPVVIPNILDENTDSLIVKKNKFEDLETELINKIRKTPYWEEFSIQSQSNMIENYFNIKMKSSKYNSIEYSNRDKQMFIQTILALANNR